MRLLDMKCSSCGGIVTQRISSKVMVCEYCGTRYVLDDDEEDLFSEDSDDAFEDEVDTSLSMAEYAAEACAEYLDSLDDTDNFKSSPKILRGLDVASGDRVFMIHDDTFMKSGKNGFAITDSGLYCRELGEQATFRDWASFSKFKEPELHDSYVKCGSHSVCYFTDNSSMLPELLDLYKKLWRAAKARF